MSILWTWPLALHFHDHIPGRPGRNFTSLWNLWWMRKALSTPDLEFFRSPYLLHPFGVDLIAQAHTALQAAVSATLLGGLTIAEAHNACIFASVLLNALCAYALAFSAAREPRAATLAAVTFGASPFVAARLSGDVHLLSAWVIPLFALFFGSSVRSGGVLAAVGAGICASIAVYSAYDLLLYLSVFAVTFAIAAVQTRQAFWRATQALTIATATLTVVALPLIVQAFRFVMSGRSGGAPFFFRMPAAGDAIAPLLGNPFHPLFGAVVTTLYENLGIDRIEGAAWIGVVPVVVLLSHRGRWYDAEEARRWKLVLMVSAVLTLFMRAMAGVYLALGMLMAERLAGLSAAARSISASSGDPRPPSFTRISRALARPSVQWALVGLLAFDYFHAPIPLTALDRPAVYEQLASIDDGNAMVDLPFRTDDSWCLYYATIHGHPVVGGFDSAASAMAQPYALMPVIGNLMRLSSGLAAVEERDSAALPFRYLVLDSKAASPELVDYVRSTLDMDLIASADDRHLYAVQGVRPPNLRAWRQ
jgi:hypothetical protein